MFSDAHLVFALLDRLDCRVWAPVTTPLRSGTFWMRLPPSSFTEANRVRGLRGFHFDRAFRDLLEEILAAGSPSSFRFVEVGASVGSCTFHVLTRVPSASAVAVEAYQLAAKVMRTGTWNGLGAWLSVRLSSQTSGAPLHEESRLGDPEGGRRPRPRPRQRVARKLGGDSEGKWEWFQKRGLAWGSRRWPGRDCIEVFGRQAAADNGQGHWSGRLGTRISERRLRPGFPHPLAAVPRI